METILQEKQVINTVKYYPAISIILPFEPMMSLKSELTYKLERIVDNIERTLKKDYTEEKVKPVLHKLKEIIHHLNFTTDKKSIAIFVSPLVEKVFYLDIPVEEKVIIDESFEIRDLVRSKKEMQRYLLLVLTGDDAKIYLGHSGKLIKVIMNMPNNIAEYENAPAGKTGNFSDPSYRKEVLLEKFLHHVDESLTILLKAYPCPLFIMGAERTMGHFNKVSRNKKSVIAAIHGNFETVDEALLSQLMQPFIADWKKVKEKQLLRKIDAAMGAKKLAAGLTDTWKAATAKKGRLLIVERNYLPPARQGSEPGVIYPLETGEDNSFYIKDAVDDIIEKVLEWGGDVEFVDDGVLSNYGQIALILYY